MNQTLIFAIPGGMELILILFIVLLFFGGSKLPSLFRGIGEGIQALNESKK